MTFVYLAKLRAKRGVDTVTVWGKRIFNTTADAEFVFNYVFIKVKSAVKKPLL